MHRIYIIAILSFVLPWSALAELVTFDGSWGRNPLFNMVYESPSGVELIFSMHEMVIEEMEIDGIPMKNFGVPGIFLPNDEGAPNLAGTGRYIAIPQGAEARLTILGSRTEVYHNVEVAPAFNIPRDDDDSPLRYEKDMTIYGQNAYYPETPVKLSEPRQIRGVDVVILGITPFQYNPVTKELIVYKDIRVRIDFIGGNGHFGEDRLRSRFWEPILQGHLLNYHSLPKIDFYAPERIKARDGYEYIIIVPDDAVFEAWADTIKAWRKLQGISCDVFTLTEVGGPSASAIENFLNNAYNTWDPAPVAFLLLSDYPSSGDLYGITSPTYSYCISDNVYADVDGDNLPDMYPARITAQSESDLNTMINKFLSYERTPYTADNFYDEPLVACGWQTDRWFQICSEIIRGFFINVLGKNPARQYQGGNPSAGCPWSTNPNTYMIVQYFGTAGLGYIPDTNPYNSAWWNNGSAAGINAAINSGAFLVQHRDHGGETGWGNPSYHNSDLNNLTNTMFTFVYSINCLTGKYNWYNECFTEKFHRIHYGAMGVNAATEVSYSFVNDTYVWGMYDCLWPEFMPDYPVYDPTNMIGHGNLRPCMAMTSGKYFLEGSSWPYNSGSKDITYHLFHHHGDAFITLYSEVPENLTVSHPGVLNVGQTTFPVTANDSSIIALTVDGEIIGVAEGTGNSVNIAIPPQLSPDTMIVTVTRANYYRYEADVPIVATGPYVIYLKHSINDIVGGNGDGMVNPGESIEMPTWVKNWGNSATGGVSGTLRVDDPFVSLTDSVKLFGHLEPGDSAFTGPDGYNFEVSLACTNGHWINFDLVTVDSLDSTWISHPSIMVKSPVLVYCSYLIDDGGQWNENGEFDAGEIVRMEVTIENKGFGDAYQIVGILKKDPADTLITIYDSSAVYGDITSGGTVSNYSDRFVVAADLSTPFGYELDMSLELTGLGGYQDTISFTLVVGASKGFTGPDDYGYYAYDNTDVVFTECPTFEWTPGTTIIPEISSHDDAWTTRTLPFIFKYYGADQTLISVSSNGWMSFGSAGGSYSHNYLIPSLQGPAAMAAPFWDDLRTDTHGDVYEYNDTANHRYILEWREVAHYSGGGWESFEIILYDPDYNPTITGDGELIFQYNRVDNSSSNTAGIEDSSETIGIQYAYNNNYHQYAAPLDSGRAIRFTTDLPVFVGGPWVLYNSYTIDDHPPGGNNNGIAEPGETVDLILVLINEGDSLAASVSAILRSEDPDVTMQDSMGTFGDIAPGSSSSNSSDPYTITVSDTPENNSMEFEIEISANAGAYQTLSYLSVSIGAVGVEEELVETIPTVFFLSHNWPNPFSHTTNISYGLPVAREITLKVYDVSGRLVRTLIDGDQKAGFYRIVWDGRDSFGRKIASGVYFYRLDAGNFTKSRKIVVMR